MALVKDKPQDIPTGNDLDDVDINPDTGLSIDAYVSFGSSPKALPNPPKDGDVVIYMVKAECTGEKKKRRKDGELRFTREMDILAVWKPGEKEPVTDDQPGLLNPDGTVNPDTQPGDPDDAEDLPTNDDADADGDD